MHQEDQRIEGILPYKTYLDVGIAVLKVLGGSVDLIELKDLACERQCIIEVILDPGEYIVLPRTTGCMFKNSAESKIEDAKLFQENGEINPQLESTLRDIFRKFNITMTQ